MNIHLNGQHLFVSWLVTLALSVSNGHCAEPQALVPGCRLELLAREPVIVTPIGVAINANGGVLVVESHTHQRPDNYDGPHSDRIRLFRDADGDGKFDAPTTFAEGFRHAMNVAVRADGAVYVVTRSDVHLLRDTDADDVADTNDVIVALETDIDYPHNGLSGIYIDGEKLFLGVGENFGGDYEIVGSDGTRIMNTGGVGTIYRCQIDGVGLARYANGFWNPFSLCVAEGHLFCVDNDPDASPPCRLIDVQRMGDYGFRFEYGRAGVHPLHAWNGELPGTLPMVCGTGEAPTAVVFHRGYLWVTSWGDHRIERYQLTATEEGTLAAERTVMVQGDADFRPTGMAVAADGSLYFADWVSRSYPVHGHGRIWRLQIPADTRSDVSVVSRPWLKKLSPELRQAVQTRWDQDELPKAACLKVLKSALASSDADLQLYAVRWIAELRLTELLSDVERLLDAPPPNERFYLAVLGALDWLTNPPRQRHSGLSDGLFLRELHNTQRSPACHTLALNAISPECPDLSLDLLLKFLHSAQSELRLAAVRALIQIPDSARLPVLEKVVRDGSRFDVAVRTEALTGLTADMSTYLPLFQELAQNGDADLKQEALRCLRLSGYGERLQTDKPPAVDLAAWNALLSQHGDPASGRRLFYNPVGPQCYKCHRHSGRGGDIGPDLTRIGATNSRERIIASILDPSREIAPQYQAWVLTTEAGRTYVGLRLPKSGDDGEESYADLSGNTFELRSDKIETRLPATTSIMPAGLEANLSVQDVRDLISFLME